VVIVPIGKLENSVTVSVFLHELNETEAIAISKKIVFFIVCFFNVNY